MDTALDSTRREFLTQKIAQRTPDELIEQIYLANSKCREKHENAYQRGIADACQWVLGITPPPMVKK
ncbi:hypothetical protein [Moritella viscosa]|uniref:RPEL repeat n=1 Tax=Moritella viscosa TaxID=80854 RepID=A0ABY1HD43_9GAMM|nr:hypothetical protein [Moritella viscosa]SGY85193.1 RPEL repeat [Moritella viscosa]SHO24717.1 RPEL repeat [Moritella viscosa]